MLSEYASASASVQQEIEFLRENMEKAHHSMMFCLECGRNCQIDWRPSGMESPTVSGWGGFPGVRRGSNIILN